MVLVTPLDMILLFLEIIQPTVGFGNVLPKFFDAILNISFVYFIIYIFKNFITIDIESADIYDFLALSLNSHYSYL